MSMTSLFPSLIRKIKKFFQDLEHRGVVISSRRMLKEVFSEKKILVYHYQCVEKRSLIIQPENFHFVEINNPPDSGRFRQLLDLWPKELEQYRKQKYLQSALMARLKNREICFLVYTTQEELVGAVWIARISQQLLDSGLLFTARDKMIKSLFVVPKMRGKGVGKLLLGRVLSVAQEKGWGDFHSIIFPERRGSIVVHEAVGFKLVGVLHKKNILFKETTNYFPMS